MPSSTGSFYSDIHLRTVKLVKSKKTTGDVITMAVSLFNKEKKFKKIIEIGTGYGQILYLLKKKGFNDLSGLDINKQAVSFIKKNFKFVKMNYGSALKINNKKKYDIVLCNGVLHHTNSLEKGLTQLNKILKKDGKIFLGLYLFKHSFFEYFVQTLRILALIFPYTFTKLLLTPFPVKYSDAILDHMYVPIIKLNTKNEIYEFFKKNNLTVKKTYSFNPLIKKNNFLKSIFYNDSFFKIYVLQKS
jgi:SAM-dependent methyltransferase